MIDMGIFEILLNSEGKYILYEKLDGTSIEFPNAKAVADYIKEELERIECEVS